MTPWDQDLGLRFASGMEAKQLKEVFDFYGKRFIQDLW